MRRTNRIAAVMLAVATLAGCVNANAVAMKMGGPPASNIDLRALESRRFATGDQRAALLAATQTLQDLGFTISESSAEVGLLSGSKVRDAEETQGVVGGIVMGLLFGANAAVWDKEQTIHVSLAAAPVGGGSQIEVRVLFDRSLKNNRGGNGRSELLLDPAMYQEFFSKLSAGMFLEAQQI